MWTLLFSLSLAKNLEWKWVDDVDMPSEISALLWSLERQNAKQGRWFAIWRTRNFSAIDYQCPKALDIAVVKSILEQFLFPQPEELPIARNGDLIFVVLRWITANLRRNFIKGSACLTCCLHTWSFLWGLCWLPRALFWWSWMFEWIDVFLRSTTL